MNPRVQIEIDGGYIRPLIESDFHQGYVDGLNNPIVNKYLDVKNVFQTEKLVLDFITTNRESPNSILFGLWIINNDNHIGTVRLHSINRRHGIADIGICIFDKQYWGMGLGKAAITAVTDWALNSLKLRWIEAGAYEANLASQKTFLSVGYKWILDVPDKFLLNDKLTTVKIYVKTR